MKPIDILAKDYFKLPFEVYYSGPIGIYDMDLMSDVKKVKKFADIKAVHLEEGNAWGLSFSCRKNNGSELYSCIFGGHDGVVPDWLDLLDEENSDMNYGCDYKVTIKDGEVIFEDLSAEEQDEDDEAFLDVYSMNSHSSFFVYLISDEIPDYIVLDAEDTRITIDADGYVLDEELNQTEERIFDSDELLARVDEFDQYTNCDLWEAKAAWIASLFEKNFPKEKPLKLSRKTL